MRSDNQKRIRRRIIAETALRVTPLLIIMGGCATFVISSFKGEFVANQKEQDLTNKVVNESVSDEIVLDNETLETETVSENEEVSYPEIIPEEKKEVLSSTLLDAGYPFVNVDFTTLKDINENACAWLVIDGTNINLPVVQGVDNEYYLKHDIEGNDSKYGTLFVDYRNNSLEVPEYDLSDFTYIYGHHMAGGKMLAPICNYKSQSYYDKHPFGIVYTPDGNAYQAEFFAGMVISGEDDGVLFTSDFIDEDSHELYITNLKVNSTFESDVNVQYGDKVLALITCSYETNNSRYVLYAKLTKQLTKVQEQEQEKTLGLN